VINELMSASIECGTRPNLAALVEEFNLTIEPCSLVGEICTPYINGPSEEQKKTIRHLDNGLANVNIRRDTMSHFIKSHIATLTQHKKLKEGDTSVSKALSELISIGYLSQIFPEVLPFKERKRKKTPDFSVENENYTLFIESYRPTESQKNRERVEDEINTHIASRESCVKVATSFSHPTTNRVKGGFYANKVIDRILNAKRDGSQLDDAHPNILWLDLYTGLGLRPEDTRPYLTGTINGYQTFGCFGVWHAFYGNTHSRLPHANYDTRFPYENSSYLQRKNGMFRDVPKLSCAIILTDSGIVVFENPWAKNPLTDSIKSQFKNVFGFRPEFSFFSPTGPYQEQLVEQELSKINWLTSTTDKE